MSPPPPIVETADGEIDLAAHPGVELLRMMIATGDPDSAIRADVRARLEDRMDDFDSWAEAWARFALGASLVRESGTGRRQRGFVHLVHLPARFPRTQPYLTGLALVWAEQASRAIGDDATADVMKAELTRLVPHHPAIAAKQPVAFQMLTDES